MFSLAVSAGDYLPAGGLAAMVGIVSSVRARIFVDEPDLGRVSMGILASVTADAYPGRQWTCSVDRMASEIVEMGARRVGELECSIDNPDGLLMPNLAVGVRIVTGSVHGGLSVPRTAVLRSGDRRLVWVLDDGRASRREILAGVEGPVYLEVRRGLDASDVVLIQGDKPISEGQRVQPRLQVQ